MADLFWRGGNLNVDDIGGRDVRIILLSLEPGSRLWLSLDNDAVQFERLPADGVGRDARTYRAIGPTAGFWNNRKELGLPDYIEDLRIVERPEDDGGAGCGFYRSETEPGLDRDAA